MDKPTNENKTPTSTVVGAVSGIVGLTLIIITVLIGAFSMAWWVGTLVLGVILFIVACLIFDLGN